MKDALTILLDQMGDAPYPNATDLAREAYLQQTTVQLFRLMLQRIEALEAASPAHSTSTPVQHVPAPFV